MATIITRETGATAKGSPLTNAEVDNNFINLNAEVSPARPTIRPTLDLDFANSKAVDSRISFTRSSAATYYDANGVLQTVRDNKPRIDFDPNTGECKGLLIEEQRTNLLAYSEYFGPNSAWQVVRAFMSSSTVLAPNGCMNARKLIESGSSDGVSNHNTRTVTISISSPTTLTLSVYVKAAERSYFRMAIGDSSSASGQIGVVFNLNTGTWTTVGSATATVATPTNIGMSAVGNGWYRCYFTNTITDTAVRPWLYTCDNTGTYNYTGDGISGLYIWGAQLETGPFVTSYIPSTTTFISRASSATYFDSTGTLRTAGTNQTRYAYGYDSASGKWISQGLVIETAATNLIDYSIPSSYLITGSGNNTWSYNAYGTGSNTCTANTAETAAPDGSYTATKAVLNTGAGTTASDSALLTYYKAGGITSGTAYTASVWVKAVSGNSGKQFQMRHVRSNTYTKFTLTDSWQRISLTEVATTTDTVLEIVLRQGAVNEDGTSSINSAVALYVWGAQLEAAYVATSYIPTYGSSVTRAADVSSSTSTTRSQDNATMTGGALSWLTQGEGTLFIDTTSINSNTSRSYIYAELGDGTGNNLISLAQTGREGVGSIVQAGTTQALAYTAAKSTYPFTSRMAVGYKYNDFALYNNGTQLGTDTSVTIPTNINVLRFGDNWQLNYPIQQAWIKKFSYYPKRVSNTELAGLTA